VPVNIPPSEILVLLLFNIDPGWDKKEKEEALKLTTQLGEAMASVGHDITHIPVYHDDLNAVLSGYNPLEYIIFNLCEGLPGVRGSEPLVAEYLEARDLTFTGADSAALAMAQDKSRVKRLMDNSGIPTPGWALFEQTSSGGWVRFPAIVKPARGHCSEGIDRYAIVTTEAELKNRIAYVLEELQQPALVEDFIDGRELHVSLWGNGRIDMLPPAEMEFSFFGDIRDHICSYEAKFVPESIYYQNVKTILPAQLSQDESRYIEQVCLAAYRAAGCRDYARIDLRLKDGIPYVLDVNPNSDISLDASTAAASELAGYSYGEFGSRIVRLAARRHPVWGNKR
jgi:D-alanine-D-alanine ligase